MQASGIRVAVRPRGIFECLDLAVMFCGRRPLAVAAATVAGAIPWVFLNHWLFDGAGDEASVFGAMLLGLETPWAAAPLTLFLGQSVFSDRFSWRDALRAFRRGLPALVLFQGLLRGVCLLIWFLAPFLFFWHYYLDPIILLERPALRRVWARRTAMNQGNVGQLLNLLGIDTATLLVGTALLAVSLSELGSLWRGRPPAEADGDGSWFMSALFSWEGQIAFFAVCGFLTVFRFFTYLDTRIRREGWDVELKLRADDTWAGFERRSSAIRGAAPAILVCLALLASPARAADAGGDDGPGDGARRALASQSFPWYDGTSDGYRPIVRAPARASGGAPRLDRHAGEAFGAVVFTTLFVAVVVGLAFLVARYGLSDGEASRERKDEAWTGVRVEDVAAALPAGLRLADGDLLARAAELAETGDFAAAMLHLHAWMLVELDRRGEIELARGKTNRQYAAEIAARRPDAAALFRRSSRLFEDAFFGRLPVSRNDFESVWERRGLVAPPAAAAMAGGVTP